MVAHWILEIECRSNFDVKFLNFTDILRIVDSWEFRPDSASAPPSRTGDHIARVDLAIEIHASFVYEKSEFVVSTTSNPFGLGGSTALQPTIVEGSLCVGSIIELRFG